jgi:hypothetical protein
MISNYLRNLTAFLKFLHSSIWVSIGLNNWEEVYTWTVLQVLPTTSEVQFFSQGESAMVSEAALQVKVQWVTRLEALHLHTLFPCNHENRGHKADPCHALHGVTPKTKVQYQVLPQGLLKQ